MQYVFSIHLFFRVVQSETKTFIQYKTDFYFIRTFCANKKERRTDSQVSSLRFFMCCLGLYGLKAAPDQTKRVKYLF